MYLGIDIGSVSLNLVLLDRALSVQHEEYVRTLGRPLQTAFDTLERLTARVPLDEIEGVALTGGGTAALSELYGIDAVNEIIAHARAAEALCPDVRTIQATVGPFLVEVAAPSSAPALPVMAQATPTPEPAPKEPGPKPGDSGSVPEWVWVVLTCGLLFIGIAGVGMLVMLVFRRVPASAEPSMDDLRKRASEILEEDYDLPGREPQPVPRPAPPIAEKVKEPEPQPEPALEESQAPPEPGENKSEQPTVVLTQEEFVAPDAEIIPEPDPNASISQSLVGGGVLMEKDSPESEEVLFEVETQTSSAAEGPKAEAGGASLTDTENDLLAEIMGEIDGLSSDEPSETESEETPEPEPEPAETPAAPDTGEASLSQAESDLLAGIMGEQAEETPPEAPAAASSGELTDTESDLLAEIMGTDEDSGGAGESPPEKPTASNLTESENDLLAEIMGDAGEAGETQPPQDDVQTSTDGTPKIPDGDDDKSDQEVIDDILKDIEGMM